MTDQIQTISVITPCFNEELNVRECHEVVRNIFANDLPNYHREHIFCDNASTDATIAILREIAATDPCVKVIVNARNFGPLCNTYNGVMASSGDAVLLFLPADLQDPPELLPEFVHHWESGYDIVYGIRATREEGFLMRWVRSFYYRLLTTFSELDVPPGAGDFQLVARRVVENMRKIQDNYPFMRMMTFECGGKALGIPYRWRARKRGAAKNRLLSLFDQGMNGIVSFTTAPIRVGLFLGFIIASAALLYSFATLILGIVYFRQFSEPGITTIIVALFFFGGAQLLFIGLIGEYILAIYGQVRHRPAVFESERINFGDSNPPTPG